MQSYFVIKMPHARQGPRAPPPISKGQRMEAEGDLPPLKQQRPNKAELKALLVQEQAKKIVA